jgi:nitroreductase
MEKKVSRREFLKVSTTGAILAATGSILAISSVKGVAEEPRAISLSKPQIDSGSPFMKLLEKRSSSREFSPEPLPLQVLSSLLWAGFGISRPDSGRRTAPTASNRQEIDIYVAGSDGLYVYDAKANTLKPLIPNDIRALTGHQAFVKEAPVNLIYVADYAKMGTLTDEDKLLYSGAATGFISENVYLYCASVGLITVVRANIDKPQLAMAMKLRPDQKITLAQSVGYPKKKV